jgi:hypothetical protein
VAYGGIEGGQKHAPVDSPTGLREEGVGVETLFDMLTNQTTWVALEAIAVVVTVGYAFLQYREMRDVRKAQERPYVIVDFDVADWLIDVAAVNIGAGAATDVKFSFKPELIDSDNRNLSQSFWLFKEGAAFLPSGKRIATLFDGANRYFGSGKPLRFQVDISYRDTQGDPWATSMTLDLSMYKGRLYVQRKGIEDVAEALEKLEKHIRKAIAPFGQGILIKTEQEISDQLEAIRQGNKEEAEAQEGQS